MDTKYQIFVSSTFSDLKEERQAVIKAIIDLQHIPAGMEMFPATGSDQLEYIKRIIDNCDYYCLILGGRYGSLAPEGISYTEAEFDYAIKRKKPILAFLHSDIEAMPAKNVDFDPEKRAKSDVFRTKVLSGRMVKFWHTISELQSGVILGLTSEMKDHPQEGWKRGQSLPDRETLERASKLSEEMNYYRKKYYDAIGKIQAYEDLTDSYVEVRYQTYGVRHSAKVACALIIREFAVPLMSGLNDVGISDGLFNIISHSFDSDVEQIDGHSISALRLYLEVFEIALEKEEWGILFITESKRYLLKAAFQDFAKVLDDIPF